VPLPKRASAGDGVSPQVIALLISKSRGAEVWRTEILRRTAAPKNASRKTDHEISISKKYIFVIKNAE
jgi:hypothetical protein